MKRKQKEKEKDKIRKRMGSNVEERLTKVGEKSNKNVKILRLLEKKKLRKRRKKSSSSGDRYFRIFLSLIIIASKLFLCVLSWTGSSRTPVWGILTFWKSYFHKERNEGKKLRRDSVFRKWENLKWKIGSLHFRYYSFWIES